MSPNKLVRLITLAEIRLVLKDTRVSLMNYYCIPYFFPEKNSFNVANIF